MKYLHTTAAFIGNLADLFQSGNAVEVRGFNTLEITSAFSEIIHPTQRCYILPHRNDNIFAKIAETLWMLAGRNDIEWLSYYLPRAPEFSDDGKCWRGGYGPRLRSWPERKRGGDVVIDQLRYAVNLLRKDPTTRQAVIDIWDPDIDTNPGKDIPCNNWLQFILRKNRLDLNVAQRSCDAMWGYSGIDTFAWSILLEMVAKWVGAEVGRFHHFIGSLHIYERHWERATKIYEEWPVNTIYDWSIPSPAFDTEFEDFDATLQLAFDIENQLRKYNWSDIADDGIDNFFRACIQMLQVYICYQDLQEVEAVIPLLNKMNESDFHCAAVEYFLRKDPDFLAKVTLTKREREALLAVTIPLSQ